MAIPKFDEKSIIEALKFIDENGVPDKNKSTQYVLVTEDGKKYPPKYVIAVADHIENGVEIATDGYNAVEAKGYFEARGYKIEIKQEKFELTITAESIVSTDNRFIIDDLGLGDNYEPIDAYFISANKETIRRKRNKSENRISNQSLPRLAFQIYEKQIVSLSDLDKKEFPVCKYNPNQDYVRGIFPSEEAYKQYKNSMEFLTYWRENGPKFIIYSWNVFSTLIFVQECLKRFGNTGDKFILVYRDKTKTENTVAKAVEAEEKKSSQECKNPYSKLLLESKNIIFRGAPGTGKSYLAKQIAADIISNGYTNQYADLTDEQRRQVEFVQFHPSYDYSDFVEGLRPKMNEDGSMGFELQDGIFKSFVDKARSNFEDSQKSKEIREQEVSAKTIMANFFANIEYGDNEYQTIKGSKFSITNVDDKHIYISIPGNETADKLSLNIAEVRKMLESGMEFNKVSDITNFFGKQFATQSYSYDFALFKAIKEAGSDGIKASVAPEELKKYIFIIDEINRGEISKIFGELFFSIDPGYRGKSGEVATQYSNMHANPDEKFYIPENVYIIGTMNDIDRSVDSFDFAMRRRFRFIEIKADDTQDMLESLENEELKNDAVNRMDKLNAEILKVDDLNENYQIGASYFLKLKTLSFDDLWTDYLHPLLQDYVRGLYDEEGIMKRFARAYGYQALGEGDADEATEN
ncbi:McrB family protein [Lacrimispora sphenoides]|uniref:AAA domain (Dynein-related subfamily) n=1 Tax=Lacrimispora sphenoides JCM 1415 TaxID=1297793 RepID=A0ABY1C2A2_9FIRM|nr:AAA family ATPase [Lacrimispora sphenoides]SET56234.1 AAA domain (dynein-related subfamily) [[Clostridium] sphenoides JCM 1415]SUY49770.1 ATPase [Lacrimispora sphenoides]